MKALCWHGKGDIRCESVPDPTIQDARDAIIKVTACTICGSDLHIAVQRYLPDLLARNENGDIDPSFRHVRRLSRAYWLSDRP